MSGHLAVQAQRAATGRVRMELQGGAANRGNLPGAVPALRTLAPLNVIEEQ